MIHFIFALAQVAESLRDAIEAFREDLLVAAETEPEMIGHVKEAARHDGGFVFVPEVVAELVDWNSIEFGKDGHPVLRGSGFEMIAGGKELVDQGNVLREDSAGPRFELGDSRECGDAQALGGVRGDAVHEVAEAPHLFDDLGLADDPAAAESAQSINLGERIGGDELIAEESCRAEVGVEGGVQVDFVDEDSRAYGPGEASDFLHRRGRNEGARGIVQIGEHYELRFRAHNFLEGFEVGLVVGRRGAGKPFDVRLQKSGGGGDQVVDRVLEDHFVARLDQGSEGDKVGH